MAIALEKIQRRENIIKNANNFSKDICLSLIPLLAQRKKVASLILNIPKPNYNSTIPTQEQIHKFNPTEKQIEELDELYDYLNRQIMLLLAI